MFQFLHWLRDWVGDEERPPEPDPAAERAVKLPQDELSIDGPDDGDRNG